MCGIFAVLNKDGLKYTKEKYINALKKIKHRGRDNTQIFLNKRNTIFMGHHRLSINDLSDAGNQPFVDNKKEFALIFNGQIYNHRSLRQLNENYSYISSCDTETLFIELKKSSIKTLEKLSGMWAFLFWDDKKDSLLISRDRFGIKPLYYYQAVNGDTCFSSEIKSILSLYPEAFKPNINSIKRYISKGWIDHTKDTFFSGIYQVPPGSYSYFNNSYIEYKKYWNLPTPTDSLTDISILKEKFIEVIDNGLLSDVPIATTLSGGIDSGSINCTIANELRKKDKIHAFSVQPSNAPDETFWIDDSVKHTGVRHNYLDFEKVNILESVDKMLLQMDEPVFNVSTIYQNLLREYISEFNYKVVLVGDGADEIFCGYAKLLPIYISSLIVEGKNDEAEIALKNGTKLTGMDITSLKRRVDNFLKKGIGGRRFQEYRRGFDIISDDDHFEISNQLFPEFEHDHLNKCKSGKLIYKELSDRFVIDIPHHLRNEDRNSMAYGIESRPLFLDHELLELTWSYPYHLLMFQGVNKYLLREIMRNTLNKSVFNLKKKFVRPGNNAYLSYGPLRKKIINYINNDSKSLFTNCSSKKLLKMYEHDSLSNSVHNAYPWFRFFSVMRWLELFF